MTKIEKLLINPPVNSCTLFILPILNQLNNFGSNTRSFFNVLSDIGFINSYLNDSINSEFNSDFSIYLFFDNKEYKEKEIVFNLLIGFDNFIDIYEYNSYTILVFSLHEYRDILLNFYKGNYSKFQETIEKLYNSSKFNFTTNKKLTNIDYHIEYVERVVKKEIKLKAKIEEFLGSKIDELHSVHNSKNNTFSGMIKDFNFYESNLFFKQLLNECK